MTKVIQVQLEESKLIDACVEAIFDEGRYDDDSSHSFRGRMQKRVEEEVKARVEAALGPAIDEAVKARVEPLIDATISKGFPTFNSYGERVSEVDFATHVRKSLDELFKKPSGYNDPWGAKAAKEAFEKHVGLAFKAEIATVQAAVRKHVDEQLSGAVVKALRDAVGLSR